MSVAEFPDDLERLGRTAQREHELATEAANSVLEHAILCGEALLAAREMVPRGEWGSWLDANVAAGEATARCYMRLARYKSHLPSGQLSMGKALAHIRGLPDTNNRGRARLDPEILGEIDRLAGTGVSFPEISETLGVSYTAVRSHLDPKYRKRQLRASNRSHKRRLAARAALRKQEEAEAVKRVGGSAADAYGVIREKLCPTLDKAIGNSQDGEEREALRAALRAAHRSEEEILKALKIGRAG